MCNKCKIRMALHTITVWAGKLNIKLVTNLCCYCYVSAGNPPADWHVDCMRAKEGLQPVPELFFHNN